MTGLAKALPVLLVPEQDGITTVRSDMIDHGCCHCMTFLYALNTQRMCLQISYPCLLPLPVVTTLAAARPVTTVQCFMLLAVQSICQLRTSGVSARLLWFHRHPPFLPSMYTGGVKGLERHRLMAT